MQLAVVQTYNSRDSLSDQRKGGSRRGMSLALNLRLHMKSGLPEMLLLQQHLRPVVPFFFRIVKEELIYRYFRAMFIVA